MFKMINTGMKRRRKETWYVSFVTFIAVLFMTGLTLFQNIMNSYVFSANLHNYGDWVISSVGRTCSHPYLMTESFVKTGQVLVNEEGKSLELRAGMADEDFGRVYDSVIYEGRFPEADGEIAMDVSALAMLGYSYELGQTIQVQFLNEAEEIRSAEFLLVGTLKNFSAIWNVQQTFQLPNFLVREKDFEQFSLAAYTTYFYRLNPMYEEINTHEFAMSFMPSEEQQQANPLTYNTYVYENKVWGSPEMFDRVTSAIMLIGVLAIGYLMVAYTGKRRETYYRCRSIGASKLQIRGMVCFECMRITIPQILLGVLGTYALAFCSCKIAQANKFAVEYIFEAELLIRQLLSALGVVILAMVAAVFSVSDKRIAGNAGKVKPSKYKRLRRVVKWTKAPEKTIFKRQHMLHPMQRVISVVLTILVCGCLLLCLFKINDRLYRTAFRLGMAKDFTMSNKETNQYDFESEPIDGMIYVGGFTPSDMSIGGDVQFEEAVRTSPGIKTMDLYWYDGVHIFQWGNMEESPIIQYIKSKQIYKTPLEYRMSMIFYEDVQAMKNDFTGDEELNPWRYRKEQNGLDVMKELENVDWDAIERGEQVIMLVESEYREADWWLDREDETVHHFEENTLKAGMDLDIVHFMEETRYTVKVAQVVTNMVPTQSYQLIGTRALAEKIMASEAKELKCSSLDIMYDTTSSYESTDKQLASLAVNNSMAYSSNAEYRRTVINEAVQDVGIYGVLFIVILVVYVTLQNSFLGSRLKFMEEKFTGLKRIGMSDAQYIRSAAWSEAKNYLWIGLGLICGYLLIFWERIVFNRVMGTPEGHIVESAKMEVESMQHIWFIVFLLLLYLLMVGTSVIRIKYMTERRQK